MKKLILIIFVFAVASISANVYKPISIQIGNETAEIVKIKYAEKMNNDRYQFVCDLMTADSTKTLAVDRDYYDTNAPFILETTAELDILLKLHPNYIPEEE